MWLNGDAQYSEHLAGHKHRKRRKEDLQNHRLRTMVHRNPEGHFTFTLPSEFWDKIALCLPFRACRFKGFYLVETSVVHSKIVIGYTATLQRQRARMSAEAWRSFRSQRE